MFKSWRLGRVFGFPVEINLSFLLLVAVLGFVYFGSGGVTPGAILGLALWVVVVFGSVLLHELGHSLVARRYGVHVSGIELSFFGGAAKMVDMPRSANHEIAIAAAGPAVSLMLGGLGLGLGTLLGSQLLGLIGYINFVLAAFNLIPALPMDGGRILRALLTFKMDFVRATDISVKVARVTAIAFVVIGLMTSAFQLLVLAPLLWLMGTRERMLARAMADQHGGYGSSSDRFGRFAGPFDDDRGWRGGGHGAGYRGPFYRTHDRTGDGPRSGLSVRRFTIRRVGGRMVIETID